MLWVVERPGVVGDPPLVGALGPGVANSQLALAVVRSFVEVVVLVVLDVAEPLRRRWPATTTSRDMTVLPSPISSASTAMARPQFAIKFRDECG